MWTPKQLYRIWCPSSMITSLLQNLLSIQTPHRYKFATTKSPSNYITTLTTVTLLQMKQSFWRILTPIFSHTKMRSLGQKSLMILMCLIGSKNKKLNPPCWTASHTLLIPSPLLKPKTKYTSQFQAYILYCGVLISLLIFFLVFFSSTETSLHWSIIPLLVSLEDH